MDPKILFFSPCSSISILEQYMSKFCFKCLLCFYHRFLQVIYVTLLKVYVKGGLFDKSKDLLKELEALGLADDEVR